MTLRFSEQCEDDFQVIWDHIAQDSAATAQKFVDQLYRECLSLAVSPFIGRLRTELQPGLGSIPFKRYQIFYRVEQEEVLVTRVLHGAVDLPRFFDLN